MSSWDADSSESTKAALTTGVNEALVGVFGELLIGSKIDDINVQFQYNQLNTEFDLDATATAVTGDGSNSAADSMAVASSATTGTATIQSKDSIRYKPGHTFYAFFTALFSGTGTGYAGPHDDEDGFAIKVVNGNMSFGYLKGGTETGSNGAAGFDDQANFNGDYDVSNLDLTKLNVFVILGGYLGIANTSLYVLKDGLRLLHTVKTEGIVAGTHVNDPVFPMRIQAINGMTVKSGSWDGGVIGGQLKAGRSFSFPNTQIISGTAADQGQVILNSTNKKTLAIFRVKDTFQGLTNKVRAQLTAYDFHVDTPGGNVVGEVDFQLVVNPTLSATAAYTDINSTSSVIEYDHTASAGASVEASAGVPLITTELGYVGSNRGGATGTVPVDAEKLRAVGYAGDVFAVVAKDVGGNNVKVRCTLSWEELF